MSHNCNKQNKKYTKCLCESLSLSLRQQPAKHRLAQLYFHNYPHSFIQKRLDTDLN